MIHRDLHLERHLGNSPSPRPWAFSHVLTSHQDKASRGPSIICLSPRQQVILASAPTPACYCLKPQQTPPMTPSDSGPALALETVSSNHFAWEMSVGSVWSWIPVLTIPDTDLWGSTCPGLRNLNSPGWFYPSPPSPSPTSHRPASYSQAYTAHPKVLITSRPSVSSLSLSRKHMELECWKRPSPVFL